MGPSKHRHNRDGRLIWYDRYEGFNVIHMASCLAKGELEKAKEYAKNNTFQDYWNYFPENEAKRLEKACERETPVSYSFRTMRSFSWIKVLFTMTENTEENSSSTRSEKTMLQVTRYTWHVKPVTCNEAAARRLASRKSQAAGKLPRYILYLKRVTRNVKQGDSA